MFCLPCDVNTTTTITYINTLIKYCRVPGCKFPYNLNHTAPVHKCPICKDYGHGARECKSSNRLEKINNLKEQTKNDIIPEELQCTVIDCPGKKYHTIEGHRCKKCNKFGHSNNCCTKCFTVGHTENECIINSLEEALEKKYITKKILKIIKLFYENRDNCFHSIYIDQETDNTLYIKKFRGKITTCFMDGTHWDNNIFSRSIFNKFIHKNQLKRNKLINQIHEWDLFYNKIYIKCPVCRKSNYNKDIHFIKGLETKEPCVVCYDSDPNIYFKQCNHVVVCEKCCDNLEIFY